MLTIQHSQALEVLWWKLLGTTYLYHKHDIVLLAESSLLMLAEAQFAQFLHHITTDIMLPLCFEVVYSASIIIPYTNCEYLI